MMVAFDRARQDVALNAPSLRVINTPSPRFPRNGMLVQMTSRMAATSKCDAMEGASFWPRGWEGGAKLRR